MTNWLCFGRDECRAEAAAGFKGISGSSSALDEVPSLVTQKQAPPRFINDGGLLGPKDYPHALTFVYLESSLHLDGMPS